MALLQTTDGFPPRTGNNMETTPMPLPKPHNQETREDFMTRCLADPATKEMDGTNEQKVAACERQYSDAKAADVPEETVGMKSVTATLGDEATGDVTAVVGTLGVVDNDGEVILRDAIPNGMKVIMSAYDHSSVKGYLRGDGAMPVEPPVGKGAITVEGDKAIFRGRYFTETQRGKEAYLTTKALGEDARWSFAYGIAAKPEKPSAEWAAKGARRILTKLGALPGADGMEVSPVPMPGGKGTGTVSLKAAAPTASVDGTDHPGDDFAYVPDPEKPSTWKLPIFDADHVRNALARWNQTELPDAAEKAKAKERLLAAARKFNVDAASLEPGKKSLQDVTLELRVARAKRALREA